MANNNLKLLQIKLDGKSVFDTYIREEDIPAVQKHLATNFTQTQIGAPPKYEYGIYTWAAYAFHPNDKRNIKESIIKLEHAQTQSQPYGKDRESHRPGKRSSG